MIAGRRSLVLSLVCLLLAGCAQGPSAPTDHPLPDQGADESGNGCMLVRGKVQACKRAPDGYGQSSDCESLREQCPWLW